MTVFVDPIRNYHNIKSPTVRRHGREWCHMISDAETDEELHSMALSIGLNKSYAQKEIPIHYDLTPNKRSLALINGAVELSLRDFTMLVIALRKLQGKSKSI